MDELFGKYERELVTLRALCREYAQRYPKVAAKLQLGGEACDDPHVERLIQAVALLCARVSKRLDDSYPQFTEALLNLLFPHYLRPFPSCAIVQIGATAPPLPRGSRLETRPINGVPCTFTTAYDVTHGETVLSDARFCMMVNAPPATRLPTDASCAVALTFTARQPGEPLAKTQAALRLYIDADPSFCASLRDLLFMRTAAAFIQCGDDPRWIRLAVIPIAAVGFDDDEALIPFDARSHLACRVLAEYFAFPEKFNFLDIDLAALLARAPEGAACVTLHLVMRDLRTDADQVRLLANLSPQHLLQGCTPVINLFRQTGVPVAYEQYAADYTVLAHGSHAQAFEVYSIDKVSLVQQTGGVPTVREFHPFYALKHGQPDGDACYWLMRRDETLVTCSPGHETKITLVDGAAATVDADRSALSLELSCTNRDLPCSIRVNGPGGDGDLHLAGTDGGGAIRFLRRPTRPARIVNGPDTQWRLISHLALNHHSLVADDGDSLREMLALYDLAQSPVTRRQIGAIHAVTSTDTTAWMRHPRGSSLVHGAEVRLTIDEDALTGAGVHLFAQVLDQLFGMTVHVSSFVELVIESQQSGKELFRCSPRSGTLRLV